MKPRPDEIPRPAPRRARGYLLKIGTLLAGLLIACLLAEGIVRWFAGEIIPNPIGPRHQFIADPVLGIDLAPGFRGRFNVADEFDVPIAINSRGCRDREFGPKAAGVVRILSLGDSFAFGYGVRAEETYAKVLEARLDAGPEGPRFEVLNAGASGRGIPHMVEVCRRTIGWFEPDVVITTFFFVNDLLDIKTFPEHTVRGGIVLTQGVGQSLDASPWLDFSVHYSDFSLLLWRSWFNFRQRAIGQPTLGGIAPPGSLWGTDMLETRGLAATTNGDGDPADADAALVARLTEREQLWARYEEHLQELAALCAAAGARLVVLNIPQEYQTRDAVWQQLVDSGEIDPVRTDRDLVSRQLTAICARVGVALCDLVPSFRATPPAPGTTRFFPVNKHFNATGNAFTAEVLARFLREHELLEAAPARRR